MPKLDREEKDLLRIVGDGDWKPVPGARRQAKRYQKYAEATLKKERRRFKSRQS